MPQKRTFCKQKTTVRLYNENVKKVIDMENKIGIRKWLSFIVAGIVGQIAWALENMYLNVYAFYASGDYNVIPLMTALSAITATVTTLLMGALSDRLGKRKAFIAFGYIIWGVSIAIFAFLDPHNTAMSLVGSSGVLAGAMIVVMDCVMTFFGSTANDASFNAFVTDNTVTENRGKVESVLSILPMVSMILIVVLAGVIVQDNHGWDTFFFIFGIITTVAGVACIFLLPKDTQEPNRTEPYIKNIFYGFRPKVIKENPLLYITLIAFCVFSIAIQIFFPYFIVYIQNVLGIVDINFMITFGVVLVVACIITVVFGLFMDRIGKNKILMPALLVCALGAFLFFFAKDMVFVIIAGIVLMSGYMISVAVFGAKVRDFTPKNEIGLFQGIRMIFVVMIPMITGPYIGDLFFLINKQTYINEYGIESLVPNNMMFLGVGLFVLLALIPTFILIRKDKNQVVEQNETVE